MAAYEKLGSELPQSAVFTCAVLYPATPFAAGTIQYLCSAPFDAKVVKVESVVNVAVNSTSVMDLKIDGGSTIGQLTSGTTISHCTFFGNTATRGAGLWCSPPGETEQLITNSVIALCGGGVTVESDNAATSGDVLICVTLQRRVS